MENATNLKLRSLFLPVLLVLGFAIGMATLLNYFKFESTLGNLQRSRMALIAREIGDSAEKGLAIGLALGHNTTLPKLLEGRRAVDRLIVALFVIDEAGRILHATDGIAKMTPGPPAWSAEQRRRGASEWSVAEPDSFVVGTTLHNSFGVFSGSVVVRYARATHERRLAAIGGELAGIGLAAFVAFALVSALALAFGVARIRRDLARAADDAGHTDAGVPAPNLLASELRAVRATADEAAAAIRDVRRQVPEV